MYVSIDGKIVVLGHCRTKKYLGPVCNFIILQGLIKIIKQKNCREWTHPRLKVYLFIFRGAYFWPSWRLQGLDKQFRFSQAIAHIYIFCSQESIETTCFTAFPLSKIIHSFYLPKRKKLITSHKITAWAICTFHPT